MISGLDDVVVAETVLSDVDGQAGRLVIRGHSLDDWLVMRPSSASLHCYGEGFSKSCPSGKSGREHRRGFRRWARPDSAYSRT